MKHLRVSKNTAHTTRKLLVDYAQMNNPVIYNNGLDEIERILDGLKPDAPSGLRATICEIKNRIGDIR